MSIVDDPHPRGQQRQHIHESSIGHYVIHLVRVACVYGVSESIVDAVECQYDLCLFSYKLTKGVRAVKRASFVDFV